MRKLLDPYSSGLLVAVVGVFIFGPSLQAEESAFWPKGADLV